MKTQTISVVLAVKNEEKHIKEYLESIQWVDEIIIVDHYSTDNTVKLARKYTSNILYGDGGPLNLIEYNVSLGIKNASKDWVLIMDADERMTEDLKKEIIAILSQNTTTVAYKGHYIYYFLGKPLKSEFLNKLYSVRLFKKGVAQYPLTSNHQDLIVNGKINNLKNPFVHLWCNSYKHLFEKANRYAKQDAYGMYFDNGNSLTKKKNVSIYTLFLEPFLYFGYLFILKKMYKDKWRGLIITISLTYYLCLTYWTLLFLKLLKRKTKEFNTACIVCQKNHWRIAIKGKINEKKYTIYQCNNCELGVIDLIPSIDYHKNTIDFYVNNQNLFNVYMKEILDYVLYYKTKGKFLDIGASIGLLAHQAKNKGFDVEAVELSKAAIEYGRKTFNIKYYDKDILSLNLKAETYDVITINHVLEHLNNPNNFLKEVHRIMKPGGILVLAVPNFGSISAQILKQRWASLQPREHLLYFTPDTLSKIMQKQKFIIKQVIVSEPYREYKWGIRSILRLLLYGPFYYFCKIISSGRNLIIVVQKPL